MRVFMCINRELGLEVLKNPTKAIVDSARKLNLCTQKQETLKLFQNASRDYIRKSLKKSCDNKFPVIILSLDIPCSELTYVSGDRLDPYTTEYDFNMDTIYSYDISRFKHDYIISVESWYFYLNKTRLKYKKVLAFR